MKAKINGTKHKHLVYAIRSSVMDGNTSVKNAITLLRGLKRAPTGNGYIVDPDEMIRLMGYLADSVTSLSSAQELAMQVQDLISNEIPY